MELILASGSPRRRQILDQLGLTDFSIRISDVDETVASTLSPSEIVESLSYRKAMAVAADCTGPALILAADTIVTIGDAVLGKPVDRADAARMLSSLAGNPHQVYTGITLLQVDGCTSRQHDKCMTEHEVTKVVFRPLSEAEIASYIATDEPMDKAGAYGIQGFGALLVERIDGDYFNVMGLPACRLGRMLTRAGLNPLDSQRR